MADPLITHALLRVGGPQALARVTGPDLPTWVGESLGRAPWVVVRRAPIRDGLVPVGVRGRLRQERYASWICADAIREYLTPQALAARRAWATANDSSRGAAIPALAALDRVDRIMSEHGLDGAWGPGGSVGFELASGVATAAPGSDLDVVVEVGRPFVDTDTACSLVAALATVPVRVDVLLEMREGAVALAEYAAAGEGNPLILRTTEGPRLTRTLGHTLRLRP